MELQRETDSEWVVSSCCFGVAGSERMNEECGESTDASVGSPPLFSDVVDVIDHGDGDCDT